MKKSSKIAVSVSVAVALAAGATIGIFHPHLASLNADTSGTAYESDYRLNPQKTYIENIPYENYLYEIETSSENVYSITDFGATPENSFSENRKAIQSAIDKASANGGGTVLVSGGNYLCANIELKSNITLFIEKNSSLENITYEQDKTENGDFPKKSNGFIFANEAENVIITGGGKLIGNGETYTKKPNTTEPYLPLNTFSTNTHFKEFKKRIRLGKCHETKRYYMLEFNNCRNVTIENIEIGGAGSWTCRMLNNENLVFNKVIINNNLEIANSDGIDILGGKNITVKNCFIATGDDGVCLKTEGDAKEIEGVTVENCEIMSNANCFKIGTGTYKDISEVSVSNCKFFRAETAGGYSGFAVEAVDGGKVSNISIDNIEMENIVCPFVLWLGTRHNNSEMENITVKNITAKNTDIAPCITGNKKADIKNVVLENIDISYRNADADLHIYPGGAKEGLNMSGYPESLNVSSSLGFCYDIPAYGLFARRVSELKIINYSVKARECETREEYYFENAKYDLCQ